MTEYRKYDTTSKNTAHFVRLTKDAEVKRFDDREVVRITYVENSRHDSDAEMWVEATPGQRQAGLAKYLKKGDVISLEGKLSMRRFGDNNEKVGFAMRMCELFIPPSLFATLKERGWDPKADAPAGKKDGKPAAKPPAKKAAPKRDVVDPDDLDLDA